MCNNSYLDLEYINTSFTHSNHSLSLHSAQLGIFNCHPVYPFEQKFFKDIKYCKILKISPGAYIWAYFWKALSTEGNLCFEIDWASRIVRSTFFTVFALFYFVLEGNFPSTSPQGGLYLEGRFNGGFFTL